MSDSVDRQERPLPLFNVVSPAHFGQLIELAWCCWVPGYFLLAAFLKSHPRATREKEHIGF